MLFLDKEKAFHNKNNNNSNMSSIVFNCFTCKTPVIRDSEAHDHSKCDPNAEDNWYCPECPVPEEDEDEEVESEEEEEYQKLYQDELKRRKELELHNDQLEEEYVQLQSTRKKLEEEYFQLQSTIQKLEDEIVIGEDALEYYPDDSDSDSDSESEEEVDRA